MMTDFARAQAFELERKDKGSKKSGERRKRKEMKVLVF